MPKLWVVEFKGKKESRTWTFIAGNRKEAFDFLKQRIGEGMCRVKVPDTVDAYEGTYELDDNQCCVYSARTWYLGA